MKILFVNKLYPPDLAGGAEVVAAILAAGHQARGHDVTVATTTSGDRIVEERIDGVCVIRLPLRNIYWHNRNLRSPFVSRLIWHALDIHNPAMGRSLGRLIRDVDPEVVCFHNIAGFSASAWTAAKRAKKPTVQILHDYYNLCPRSQLFRDEKSCERRCLDCRIFRIGRRDAGNQLQAVLGVSHAVLDTHLKYGLFDKVRLRQVINNALPQEPSAPATYPETARVFGFIGTLSECKGVRRLLEAFRRLQADPTLPPVRLLVAGGGDAAYVAELQRSFASDRIEFLGRVVSQSFYTRVDALVVPSLWRDPLPTVIAESKVFGVPVLGARRGGMPEMIAHEVDGLLYEPDGANEFENAARRLITTPGLLRRLGSGARASAARFTNMEHMLDQHIAAYQAAIETMS